MKLSNFLHDIILAIKVFDIDYDSFSKGQLESKEWLVEILKDIQLVKKINYGIIFNLCGWYGILPAMLWLQNIHCSKIRSFDIDENCREIANRINRTSLQNDWSFQAITKDIFSLTFDHDSYDLWSYGKKKWFKVTETPDTIINTSCEHTNRDWYENVPDNKFVVLQSNNFFEIEEHINCVNDKEEMKKMYPMKKVYYNGQFNCEKYTRFMQIGIK